MTLRDIHSRLRTHRYRHGAIALLMTGALGISALPVAPATHAARPALRARINLGTKNFPEEYIISNMYRLLLQKAGFNVAYHDLGGTPQLQAALLNGSIDLYPEYTGTGLQVLGIQRIMTNPWKTYRLVKRQYARRFNLRWLAQTPMNDTNGVGVTQATAAKYRLRTLSDLARVAGQFSFAGPPACQTRPDCYAGMRKFYGIRFKQFIGLDAAPLRYQGLKSGQYNSIEVFTTDGQIQADRVVVLRDNKQAVFPADRIAPVVRGSILRKYPRIARVLNRLAPYITTPVMSRLNARVVINRADALQVARSFLRSKGLI